MYKSLSLVILRPENYSILQLNIINNSRKQHKNAITMKTTTVVKHKGHIINNELANNYSKNTGITKMRDNSL